MRIYILKRYLKKTQPILNDEKLTKFSIKIINVFEFQFVFIANKTITRIL